MILDDTHLTDLVRGAGDTIEVPTEGPERILARRNELAGHGRVVAGDHRRWLIDRRWLTAVAVVAAVVAVVGGGALFLGGNGTPARFSAASTPQGPLANGSSAGASVGGTSAKGAGATGAGTGTNFGGAPSPAQGSPSATVAPPALPTRVIKTGSVSLVLANGRLSATVDELTSLVAGLGGYVTDAKSAEGGGTPTGDLTLRVPVGQFETLLGRVRALGKPTSITTSGQDVTAQFVDLDARIRSLQATRDQFLQVLAKATQIGDILNVEQQLSGIQTQIEELQGQQRVLDDQTTFGTLAVHLSEGGTSADLVPVGPVRGPSGWTTAWRHARHSFARGIQAVISASGGFAIFVLIVGLLALVARVAWAVSRRRLV